MLLNVLFLTATLLNQVSRAGCLLANNCLKQDLVHMEGRV